MKMTTVPKMGDGKGKDGGDGHKKVDDVQNNEDGLVAAVDDVDQEETILNKW